jgi:tetratricopeptide (TPR) repeat protein
LLRGKEEVAFALAQESVEIDQLLPNDELPYGHVQLAYLYLYKGDHNQAKTEADLAYQFGEAIAGYSEGRAVLAQVLTYRGDPKGAVDLMLHLVEHPPVPAYYYRQLGQAYYVMGQIEKYQKGDAQQAMVHYQEAEGVLIGAKELNRQVRLTLAAVYVESGQDRKARDLFAADPHMRRHIDIVDRQRRRQAPYWDPEMTQRYISALRTAGS